MKPRLRIVRIHKPRILGRCKACNTLVHEGEGTQVNGITLCYSCDTGMDTTDPIIRRAQRGETIEGHKVA